MHVCRALHIHVYIHISHLSTYLSPYFTITLQHTATHVYRAVIVQVCVSVRAHGAVLTLEHTKGTSGNVPRGRQRLASSLNCQVSSARKSNVCRAPLPKNLTMQESTNWCHPIRIVDMESRTRVLSLCVCLCLLSASISAYVCVGVSLFLSHSASLSLSLPFSGFLPLTLPLSLALELSLSSAIVDYTQENSLTLTHLLSKLHNFANVRIAFLVVSPLG